MKFNAGIPISAKRFRWSQGNGYAEASELPDLKQHQIWPDACDVGFTIRSERTGELRTFVETHVNRDDEREIESWVYSSVNNRNGHIDRPGALLTITIYND